MYSGVPFTRPDLGFSQYNIVIIQTFCKDCARVENEKRDELQQIVEEVEARLLKKWRRDC